MCRRKKSSGGFTFLEVFISTTLLSITVLAFIILMRMMTRHLVGQDNSVSATMESQTLFAYLEPDLNSANQVEVAVSTECRFRTDFNRHPSFNPAGDFDGDGTINEMDTDVDEDASAILPPGQKWRGGYNLKDDDDDNDGKIDTRVRVYAASKSLFIDYSYNEQPWGQHVKKIAGDVASVNFTYFGSKDTGLKAVDTNNDGVTTAQEIDLTLPPTGSGNANGRLDTISELAYIVSIRMHIEFDSNQDNKIDYALDFEVSPPLLSVKPLQI